jgi:hypothetical protein
MQFVPMSVYCSKKDFGLGISFVEHISSERSLIALYVNKKGISVCLLFLRLTLN